MNNIDFNKVFWGQDYAEGDDNLDSYFLQIPGFDKIATGEKRYIIGRKGTGKSAVLEKIILNSRKGTDKLHKALSLKDFPLQDLISFKEKAYQNKSQYSPIWRFLIIIELCKMIIADRTTSNDYYKDLIVRMLNDNGLNLDAGFADTITVLRSSNAKIQIATPLGGEYSQSAANEVTVTIHYTKAADRIVEFLKNIQSKSTYYILFDQLDEGYSDLDKGKKTLLLSLLSAIETVCRDGNLKHIQKRPVLALRSDIYDAFEDNDANKYDDFCIRLDWIARPGNQFSLRDLVNLRISNSLNVLANSSDPWEHCVNEEDGGRKTIWQYMNERTFERPRDIVKFLKICTAKNRILTRDDVYDNEINYSVWFYKEIRDEIQSYLPVWKQSLAAIQKSGRTIIRTDALRSNLTADQDISEFLSNNNKNVDYILKQLFLFSVIGNINEDVRNKVSFRYKDDDFLFDSSATSVAVHFGLVHKLRLQFGQ